MKKILLSVMWVAWLVACTDHVAEFDDRYETYNVSLELTNGKFTDKRDGKKYSVVKIGNQIWMAENLRYIDSSNTENLKGNLWCYENSKDSCEKYGPLYSWTAAMNIDKKYVSTYVSYWETNSSGICPENWKIPSLEDWKRLLNSLSQINGDELVGPGMKTIKGWEQTDAASRALNRFGFYALPAGRRNSEGGDFMSTGRYAFFWAEDQIDEATSYGWSLRYDWDIFDNGKYYKDHGMSVRCVYSVNYDEAKITGEFDSTYLDEIPFEYGKMMLGERSYKTIKIGTQNWMAENAAYKIDESWCYNDDEKNCDKYGRLYSFESAKKICPEGWRLPIESDFDEFANFVSVGKALRSRSFWTEKGVRGMNLWGFNALPAGGRETGDFFDETYSFYMWGSNQSVLWLRYYDDAITISPKDSKNAFSVRCIEE